MERKLFEGLMSEFIEHIKPEHVYAKAILKEALGSFEEETRAINHAALIERAALDDEVSRTDYRG